MIAPDGLPALIRFADVKAALEGLGIEVDHTLSVRFGVDEVTVERIRTLNNGNALIAGRDSLATVTTTIGYLK